jgi:hypothetical protein
MTDVNSRVVRFYLSARGRTALRGLVPARGSFQAQVVDTVGLGPLVYVSAARHGHASEDRIPVMLLRWDYIASMTFDYEAEKIAPRGSIGFTPA